MDENGDEKDSVSPVSIERLEEKLNQVLENKLKDILEENEKLRRELNETKSSLNDVCKTLNESGLSTGNDEESNAAVSLKSLGFRNRSLVKKSIVYHNQLDDSEIAVAKSLVLNDDIKNNSNMISDSSVKPRNIFASFFHTIYKIIKTKIDLENTNTINMYCATLHYPRNGKAFTSSEKAKASSYCLFSLLIFVLQIWALVYFVWESAHPTCATQQDCNAGLYCSWDNYYVQPRCSDCGWMLLKEKLHDNCHAAHEQLSSKGWDNLDYSKLWIESAGSDTTIHIDSVVQDILANYSTFDTTSDRDKCLHYHHCAAGTMANFTESVCPFLRLNSQMLTYDRLSILFFLSLLFTVSLLSSMETAAVEKTVLEQIIKRLRRDKISVPYFAQLTLALIRANAYILPWYIASVTVSIVVTDPISIKNIVLNFLAVLFIADTDDLIGYFIVTPSEMLHADKVIGSVKDDESKFSVFFGRVRVAGIIITVSIFVVISRFEQIALMLRLGSIESCAQIPQTIITIFWQYLPFFNILFVETFWFLLFSRKSRSIVVGALKEVLKNVIALFLVNVISTLAYIAIIKLDRWHVYEYAYYSLGIQLFSLVVLIISYARIKFIKRKSWDIKLILLDTMLTVACCACFYYFLVSPITLDTSEAPVGIRKVFTSRIHDTDGL